MASRKERKEALRRERERREAAAKAAQRRKQLVGYGAGGTLVVAVVAVLAVLLLSSGGGGSGEQASANSGVLPDGGSVPDTRLTDLDPAAQAAGCELSQNRAADRNHTTDPSEEVDYEQNPPNSGRHFQVEAQDGAYEEAPREEELMHSLEHGRVAIWFKPGLREEARASLKAFYDDDSYQLLVAPRRNMDSAVAATAWGAEPQPLGTGYSLTCPQYDERVFDALRAFRDEHRSNGPEPVP